MKTVQTIAAVVTSSALALTASTFAAPNGADTTQITVAQSNVQNVQVVGPTPSPSNLQSFGAVSSPGGTVVPAPTSGAGLSSLIAITPQNSGAATPSASPVTAPTTAATMNALIETPYQVRYQNNLAVGDGIVNTTKSPAGAPAPSASPATTNVPIQGSQVNQVNQTKGTGTGPVTPTNNISIQGSQANLTAAPLTTTIPSTKNITIRNSQANANSPTATTLPNKGKTADAGSREFNRHSRTKGKDRGQEGNDRSQHYPRKMQSSHLQQDQQGDHNGKGKVRPAATPE